MRAAMAGPRTCVGGFHKKAAVFKPSPEAKLFGSGNGCRIVATAESTVFPPTLFVEERLSYARMQFLSVSLAQFRTPGARTPVVRSTSRTLFLTMMVLPILKQLPAPVVALHVGSASK